MRILEIRGFMGYNLTIMWISAMRNVQTYEYNGLYQLTGVSGQSRSHPGSTKTSIYYYAARYLDPKTSRWLSGDSAWTT
jgi:hypothetical protein